MLQKYYLIKMKKLNFVKIMLYERVSQFQLVHKIMLPISFSVFQITTVFD